MSIYIKLSGGLGNQLFQYALGRSLAIKHSCPLEIDTTWYNNIPNGSTPRTILLKDLNIVANFIDSKGSFEKIIEPKNWLKRLTKSLKKERQHFKFDKAIETLKPPIYLDGYWQSYKYFEKIRSYLLCEIVPRDSDKSNYCAFETLIVNSRSPVAIHIRRGDYISSESASKIHGTLSISYYKKAISQLSQSATGQTFFFFSDDINWVKNHFDSAENFYFVTPSNAHDSAVHELYLMSLCKHFIIANSTLSWWGAWLGTHQDKVVISPRKWLEDLDSRSTDLILPNWITLEDNANDGH